MSSRFKSLEGGPGTCQGRKKAPDYAPLSDRIAIGANAHFR